MKNYLLTNFLLISVINTAQVAGNVNYDNNSYTPQTAPRIINNSYTSNPNEMVISIEGIYNKKADAEIAVFSILQLGKTAEETTSLMDERINAVIKEIQLYNKDIEIITDMISFVPKYEYVAEKKIFNPKTYNEKASGFELRKNLIVKLKNETELNKIINICAKQEIYDLAKVDYISKSIDQARAELQEKAIKEYNTLITNYSSITNVDLSKKEKLIEEGYYIQYPMESYKNYTAFSSASINSNKAVTNSVEKNITQYYDSVPIKSQTFIINPEITEPSIQLFYKLTVKIKLKEDLLPKNTLQKNNKYYMVTPTGDIKLLNL